MAFFSLPTLRLAVHFELYEVNRECYGIQRLWANHNLGPELSVLKGLIWRCVEYSLITYWNSIKCFDLTMLLLPGGSKHLSFECTWHVCYVFSHKRKAIIILNALLQIFSIMAGCHFFPDHYHSQTPTWFGQMNTNSILMRQCIWNRILHHGMGLWAWIQIKKIVSSSGVVPSPQYWIWKCISGQIKTLKCLRNPTVYFRKFSLQFFHWSVMAI